MRQQFQSFPSETMTETFYEFPRPGVETEYRAVLDRNIALGRTLPKEGIQASQNRVVKRLKDNDIYTGLDLFYIFATDAGKGPFARTNFVTPASYYITEVGTIQHLPFTGFYRNKLSGNYLNTGFKPSSNGIQGTLADISLFAGVEEITGASVAHFAGSDLNNDTFRFSATQTIGELNNSSTLAVTAPRRNGLFHVQYTGGTISIFWNGTLIASSVLGVTAVSNYDTLLLGDGNVAAVDAKISWFGRGASLVGKERILSDIYNEYMTSL